MSGNEILYCTKESFSMLFTLQGIIAWLSLSVLCGVFMASLKRWSLLHALAGSLVYNFMLCFEILLFLIAYHKNCKELLWVGFFIIIEAAPMFIIILLFIVEILFLIRRKIILYFVKILAKK